MRKTVVPLTLILVLLAATFESVAEPASAAEAATENSWTSKAPMHQARGGLGVAAVHGKIYAIGGSTESGDITSTLTQPTIQDVNEEYDPPTDTWTLKAPMPVPLSGFAITTFQDKIYCIGDGVNEIYDPATNSWTTKTPPPVTRHGAQASVVDGKIYLIGGTVTNNSSPLGATPSNLNEIYEPATDSWTTKAPMPTGIWATSSTSAVVDNKIYVIGGLNASTNLNLNQIYDPQTDEWCYGASPPVLMYGWSGGASAAATAGVLAPKRIYVLSVVSTSNQVYNPKTDRWSTGTEVPTKRQDAGLVVVNDILYAIGGRSYRFAYPDDNVGVYETSYTANEQYTPIGYGTPDPFYRPQTGSTSPAISVLSPENKTYAYSSVPLSFVTDRSTLWMSYSLDSQEAVTIAGNVTIVELSSGLHNLTVYANDTFGNMGVSETVNFIVDAPEPFPVVPIAAGVGAVTVVVVAAGLLLYNRKRHKETAQT